MAKKTHEKNGVQFYHHSHGKWHFKATRPDGTEFVYGDFVKGVMQASQVAGAVAGFIKRNKTQTLDGMARFHISKILQAA